MVLAAPCLTADHTWQERRQPMITQEAMADKLSAASAEHGTEPWKFVLQTEKSPH